MVERAEAGAPAGLIDDRAAVAAERRRREQWIDRGAREPTRTPDIADPAEFGMVAQDAEATCNVHRIGHVLAHIASDLGAQSRGGQARYPGTRRRRRKTHRQQSGKLAGRRLSTPCRPSIIARRASWPGCCAGSPAEKSHWNAIYAVSRKKFRPPSPWPAEAIERRTVASLIPYARNARKHTAKHVAEIAASKRCRSSRPPTPPPPFSRLSVLAAPRPASGLSRPHPAPQGRGRAVGTAGTLDRIQALRATTCGLGCRGDQSSGSGTTAARRTASASVSAAAGFSK